MKDFRVFRADTDSGYKFIHFEKRELNCNLAGYVTLNQNSDFRRVYGRGRSYVCPVLVVYVMRNRTGYSRYGITVSKKVGKAVKRNRAKRVINAALVNHLSEIKDGYDVVFVARVRTANVKSTFVEKMMVSLLNSAGIMKKIKVQQK